ncbi:Conserved_hypothetical protein [Hexamita inflata]|uniref:Transmembrane protein n=1 Tax=Hexamita inflata TaxID=28002 RepID=A0AA86V746_9EUKA|nr:Conserved hypothetical protein [Hexamita inflata]
MQYLQIVLSLNCFSLKSKIVYQSQSESVDFIGVYDQDLPDQELAICNSQLIGKHYITTIYVGDIKFISSQYEYTSDNISISLSCASGFDCSYANIKQYSIASFEFSFTDINIQLQGAAGQLRYRIFDHKKCHKQAVLNYDLRSASAIYNIQLTPNSRCITQPVSASGLFSGLILNQNTMWNSTDLAANPQPNFVQTTTSYSLQCSLLPIADQPGCIIKLQQIQNASTSSLYLFYQTKTQITKNDGTRTFVQTVKTKITEQNTIYADDCFTRVTGVFFDDKIALTFYPGAGVTCTDANYKAAFNFDSIIFTIIVNQNADYSGFTFNEQMSVEKLSSDQQNFDLTCAQLNETTCGSTLPQIKTLNSNATGKLSWGFVKNGALIHKYEIQLELLLATYQKASIVVKPDQICFALDQNMSLSQRVKITLGEFKIQFDVQLENDTICEPIESSWVNKLVTLKEYEKIVQVDTQTVPNIDVLLLGGDITYWQPWVVVGGLTITGIIFGWLVMKRW